MLVKVAYRAYFLITRTNRKNYDMPKGVLQTNEAKAYCLASARSRLGSGSYQLSFNTSAPLRYIHRAEVRRGAMQYCEIYAPEKEKSHAEYA